jgi:MFS family permease
MASTESRTVNAAGLVQGIVLVTFPAASTILTDPSRYALSSSEYGLLFVPQVVTAVLASLLGGTLVRRFSIKRVYLTGLGASVVAMLLLVASAPVAGDTGAFALLLAATAFVGLGFGLTVPALNTLAAALHPDRVDRAVLVLNALLGGGTALAPIFVAIFVGLGFWWGLPILSTVLLVVVLVVSRRLPLEVASAPPPTAAAPRHALPGRFWLFAGFAVLYGICETMNGNWAQTDMTTRLGASTAQASLALTVFWAMVTLGRVVFSAAEKRLPAFRTYRILPFVLAIGLVLVAVDGHGSPTTAVVTFGLAGLGCSALLPLTISFAEEQLTSISTAVAGLVIAAYQVGYGLAAFGTGSLLGAGISLSSLYGVAAALALVMGLASFVITARPGAPAEQRAPAG